MKICTTCKIEKELSEFNKNKCRKDGLNTLCKVCSRERSRKYYKDHPEYHKKQVNKRNKKIREDNQNKLLELFNKSKCADCGNNDIRVLEFDHLPEYKKSTNISYISRNSYCWNTVKSEIDKCEIVCANCHRIRTIERSKVHYRKHRGTS